MRSFSSVAWLRGSHTCFAAGVVVLLPNPVLADTVVVGSIPVVDYMVAAAGPRVAVGVDTEFRMVVVVVLPVACLSHNCRRSGCRNSLVLHTGGRDTSAAA